MYLGDKKVRFTVRIPENLSDYIFSLSEKFGTSPSEAIRLIIFRSYMNDILREESFREVSRRENEITDFNS